MSSGLGTNWASCAYDTTGVRPNNAIAAAVRREDLYGISIFRAFAPIEPNSGSIVLARRFPSITAGSFKSRARIAVGRSRPGERRASPELPCSP